METNENYTTEYVTSLHGNPVWEAIWSVIKEWDIQRQPGRGYSGATGEDVTRIFDAIHTPPPSTPGAQET